MISLLVRCTIISFASLGDWYEINFIRAHVMSINGANGSVRSSMSTWNHVFHQISTIGHIISLKRWPSFELNNVKASISILSHDISSARGHLLLKHLLRGKYSNSSRLDKGSSLKQVARLAGAQPIYSPRALRQMGPLYWIRVFRLVALTFSLELIGISLWRQCTSDCCCYCCFASAHLNSW